MNGNTRQAKVPVELLYQALETEKGGVQIYVTALRCAVNPDLRREWNNYLEQTKNHVQTLSDILRGMNLDVDTETPGRKVVRYLGSSLVKTMEMALRLADVQAAQIVASECVVLAETKDHLNWELIGRLASNDPDDNASSLAEAYAEVKEQEDAHLYHTQRWARELWVEALGMPAVLPPPDEQKKVKIPVDVAKAKKARAKRA